MNSPQRTVAMIGSRGHWNILTRELPHLPQLRLVGVAPGGGDDSAEPVLEACAKVGISAPKFESWERMLDETKPDIAVVCGPFEDHARMTVAAMDRKIHVVAEKLVALTFDELAQLEAAVARNPGIHLAAMMQMRYDPGFYTAWKLIRSGAIGDVALINARKSYRLGSRPAYYHRRDTYGGTIPWVGSHAVDWIYFLSGSQFRTVHAFHTAARNEGNGTMERSAVVHFQLDNDRLASASIDVFRPQTAPSHGDDWVRVVGTQGVLEARPNSLSLINAENNGSQPVPVACDRTFMTDFLAHIDGLRPAILGIDDTLKVTRACLLARQSADGGGVLWF